MDLKDSGAASGVPVSSHSLAIIDLDESAYPVSPEGPGAAELARYNNIRFHVKRYVLLNIRQ